MTSPGSGATIDIGARLRAAREQRGLQLRQIADRTRISVMALEALERNDVKRLPGGIFTRAFLRAYAAEVGLDPERTVQDFLAQFPHDAVMTVGPGGQVEDTEAVESDRRVAETVVRLVALSLPLAGAVVYFSMRSPESPDVQGSVERPPAVARAADADTVEPRFLEDPAAVPEPASSPPARTAAAATGALTMVVEPRGDCWLSPTVDGEKVPSELLASGQRRELRAAREIVITVGDAAACAYTLNGRAGRPFGGQGQVVTRRITLDNYRTFLNE